jgi:hypothetical protein
MPSCRLYSLYLILRVTSSLGGVRSYSGLTRMRAPSYTSTNWRSMSCVGIWRLIDSATFNNFFLVSLSARLVVQELEDCRLSIEGFSRYLVGYLLNLQIYLSARNRAFSQFLDFETVSEEDMCALHAYLDAISAALFELESRFSDS